MAKAMTAKAVKGSGWNGFFFFIWFIGLVGLCELGLVGPMGSEIEEDQDFVKADGFSRKTRGECRAKKGFGLLV
jgi:hypothetical protein